MFADPADAGEMAALADALYAAGQDDLAVGRLFEGHVDALQIVHRYGASDQARDAASAARAGALFGVWNAPLPGAPLGFADGRVDGGKSFASGADLLSRALVTANAGSKETVQLLLVDLADAPPAIDRGSWDIAGMQDSRSFTVRWENAPAEPVGAPGDYEREPFFSGGAWRFVAVQAGGVMGLATRARDHLVAAARAEDPIQLARLGDLASLALDARGRVDRLVAGWFGWDDARRIAEVAAARVGVVAHANGALRLARAAVGVQSYFASHPLSRHASDLAVYICQPGPDAQRIRTGEALRDGRIG